MASHLTENPPCLKRSHRALTPAFPSVMTVIKKADTVGPKGEMSKMMKLRPAEPMSIAEVPSPSGKGRTSKMKRDHQDQLQAKAMKKNKANFLGSRFFARWLDPVSCIFHILRSMIPGAAHGSGCAIENDDLNIWQGWGRGHPAHGGTRW